MAFQSSELDLTASYTVTNYTRLVTRRLPPGRVIVQFAWHNRGFHTERRQGGAPLLLLFWAPHCSNNKTVSFWSLIVQLFLMRNKKKWYFPLELTSVPWPLGRECFPGPCQQQTTWLHFITLIDLFEKWRLLISINWILLTKEMSPIMRESMSNAAKLQSCWPKSCRMTDIWKTWE